MWIYEHLTPRCSCTSPALRGEAQFANKSGDCFPWKVGSLWSIHSSWLMVVP